MPFPPLQQLISRRGVCERYSKKATRTVRRWVKKGVLPPPDLIINNQEYWFESTLVANERRAVAEKSAAST